MQFLTMSYQTDQYSEMVKSFKDSRPMTAKVFSEYQTA